MLRRPDAALVGRPFPLLVDEWQMGPEVLGSVKRAVDEGAAPGSFVLTGSSQADLTAAGWPATGRLITRALRGGFPEAALAASEKASHAALSPGHSRQHRWDADTEDNHRRGWNRAPDRQCLRFAA
jgi:hypothetical protein